jgi:hypothetical protein
MRIGTMAARRPFQPFTRYAPLIIANVCSLRTPTGAPDPQRSHDLQRFDGLLAGVELPFDRSRLMLGHCP